jgi:hypothetical protein
MDWGVNEWVAVVSAVIALVSFGLNWLVVRRQTELQYETLRAEMDAEVISWAHEAIDGVSQAAAVARGRGVTYSADETRRLAFEACQTLSSIADRGRLFFPNESPETHGRDKEVAFQGYRPPILDAVVFASTRIGRMETAAAEPDTEAADFLTKCRRLLVSEAQNAIDPRRRGQMLRRLSVGRTDDKTSAYTLSAELGEGLESLYPGYLLERRDAAWIANREKISRQSR